MAWTGVLNEFLSHTLGPGCWDIDFRLSAEIPDWAHPVIVGLLPEVFGRLGISDVTASTTADTVSLRLTVRDDAPFSTIWQGVAWALQMMTDPFGVSISIRACGEAFVPPPPPPRPSPGPGPGPRPSPDAQREDQRVPVLPLLLLGLAVILVAR